jgi:hypothetical protein
MNKITRLQRRLWQTRSHGSGHSLGLCAISELLAAKRGLTLICLGASLAFATASADGALFEFSYQFTGNVNAGSGLVTGTFDGVQNGDVIDVIKDVTLSIDGMSVSPAMISWHDSSSATAVMSTDVSKNDFWFGNNNGYGDSGFFYIEQGTTPLAVMYTPSYRNYSDSSVNQANWSVSAVPEANTTVAGILGLGVAFGFTVFRRNPRVSTA